MINIYDPDVELGILEGLEDTGMDPRSCHAAATALSVSLEVETIEMQADFIAGEASRNPDSALRLLALGTADRKKMGNEAANLIIQHVHRQTA